GRVPESGHLAVDSRRVRQDRRRRLLRASLSGGRRLRPLRGPGAGCGQGDGVRVFERSEPNGPPPTGGGASLDDRNRGRQHDGLPPRLLGTVPLPPPATFRGQDRARGRGLRRDPALFRVSVRVLCCPSRARSHIRGFRVALRSRRRGRLARVRPREVRRPGSRRHPGTVNIAIVADGRLDTDPRASALGWSLRHVGNTVIAIDLAGKSAWADVRVSVAPRVPEAGGPVGSLLRRIQPRSIEARWRRQRLASALARSGADLAYPMAPDLHEFLSTMTSTPLMRQPTWDPSGPDLVTLAPHDPTLSTSPAGPGMDHHSVLDQSDGYEP